MFLVKRDNFNKTYIIKGFITALFLSTFIYLNYFGIENKLLNSLLGLVGIYFFLTIKRAELFFAGFFTAILWFYWVGISFQYYDLTYLSVFVVFAFGLGYGILFLLCSLINSIYFRIACILLLSYIHPFSFNWFIPELVFINSYFDTSKVAFALILLSIYLFIKLNKYFKVLAVIPLFFTLAKNLENTQMPDLKIYQPQLMIKQDNKWNKENLSAIINTNLNEIDIAIKNDNDLVVLPETTFPMVLNKEDFLLDYLLEKSHQISIIAGALYFDEGNYYNATYYFRNGDIKIAKKVVLVPFGEKIPLPKFLVDFINNTFYNGAQDYKEATSPTDFIINGTKFRNAICYEATSEKLYKDLKDTKYMIAISNNAWFTPSIEPTLQKMIIQYFARKYQITVFHSVNGSENYIIKP